MLETLKQVTIPFSKYDASGNDFICIDNRSNQYSNCRPEYWAKLCHRRHGIGADGVLLLSNAKSASFRMTIINADGSEAEMCGNGLRAISAFARSLGIELQKNCYHIQTMNAIYPAELVGAEQGLWQILMSEERDWNSISVADLFPTHQKAFYLNTGVPHTLFQLAEVTSLDLDRMGLPLSLDKRFADGSNINFFQQLDQRHLRLRTFERGVNAETYSCGTGVAACAWSYARTQNDFSPLKISTKGGDFRVEWKQNKLYLTAPVVNTFNGTTKLNLI
jgi:diaminopimelate epimerase